MTTTQAQQPTARTPSLEVGCAGCGVPMKLRGKQRDIAAAGRPVYHSQECRNQHTRVTVSCANCGKEEQRPPSMVDRNTTGRAFCSNECRNTMGSKPKTGRYVPCAHCGTDVWVKKSMDRDDVDRYCSLDCKNAAQRAGRVEQECTHCRKIELVPPSKVSPYCSSECAGAARRRAPGETWLDSRGYLWEFVADGGRRPQHRLRMEELVGRPLLTEEEVHHLNGNRADNRVDGPLQPWHGKLRSGNLELWSTSQPAGQEVPAKVAWARELLALYGDLVPEQ